MLSREKIIRFTFEGAALVVFGIIISLLAMVLTDSSTNRRIQNGYRQSFGTVLDATSYEPVQSPLIKAYSGVEYVYEGLDEDGNPVYEVDEDGEPILDEDGNPIPVMVQQ